MSSGQSTTRQGILEASFGVLASHPNVVTTYRYDLIDQRDMWKRQIRRKVRALPGNTVVLSGSFSVCVPYGVCFGVCVLDVVLAFVSFLVTSCWCLLVNSCLCVLVF